MPIKLPVLVRFGRKVIVADECWEWTGSRNENGYGVFWYEGKRQKAHRAAYQLFVGPIPEGMSIHHRCANRSCVNPAHLEPMPFRENVLLGDNPMAREARQTHCKRGHPLSGPNLYRTPSGSRVCRTCKKLRAQGVLRGDLAHR